MGSNGHRDFVQRPNWTHHSSQMILSKYLSLRQLSRIAGGGTALGTRDGAMLKRNKRVVRTGSELTVEEDDKIKTTSEEKKGLGSMKSSEIARAMMDLDFRRKPDAMQKHMTREPFSNNTMNRNHGKRGNDMFIDEIDMRESKGSTHRSKMRLLSERLDRLDASSDTVSKENNVRYQKLRNRLRDGIQELFHREELQELKFLRKYGMPIVIADVKLSNDLKHAIIYWEPPLSFELDVTNMNRYSESLMIAQQPTLGGTSPDTRIGSGSEMTQEQIMKQQRLNINREKRKNDYLLLVDKFLKKNVTHIRELTGRYIGLWNMPLMEFRPYPQNKKQLEDILSKLV